MTQHSAWRVGVAQQVVVEWRNKGSFALVSSSQNQRTPLGPEVWAQTSLQGPGEGAFSCG